MHGRDEARTQDAVPRRTRLSRPAANTRTPSHELLSLQARAGNASVAQLLGEGVTPGPGGRPARSLWAWSIDNTD